MNTTMIVWVQSCQPRMVWRVEEIAVVVGPLERKHFQTGHSGHVHNLWQLQIFLVGRRSMLVLFHSDLHVLYFLWFCRSGLQTNVPWLKVCLRRHRTCYYLDSDLTNFPAIRSDLASHSNKTTVKWLKFVVVFARCRDVLVYGHTAGPVWPLADQCSVWRVEKTSKVSGFLGIAYTVK